MDHDFVLWVVFLATALHAYEEHQLNWLDWANDLLGPRIGATLTWTDFYVTNFSVLMVGIAGAAIGWRSPEVALALPALLVVNALVFHIAPTVANRRFSPGTLTAVTLYLPVAAWTYWAAAEDGVLDGQVLVISIAGGVALMAYPLVLARLRSKLRYVRAG